MTAIQLGSALENEVSSLQAEFRSVRDTLQGYKEQNEKQAEEIEALRARTSALEEENSKLQNANKSLEDKFSSLQKGLADRFEKSKSKSSKAASVDIKLASMQTEVTELRTSLDSSKKELQDGIETLKREQENLKTNAKDSKKMAADLKNGLERLDKEMAAVKEKDETNVQQMSEAIQRLKSQISKVDTPVAFYAVLNKTLTTTRSETLALDGLVSNVGGRYNTTTGVFTAPVRGTYIIMATSGPNQDRGKTSLAMMMEKANQGRPRLISYLFAFDFAMSTCHASQELEEGDKVWLESYAEDEEENTFSGHRWTTFTGMLVQPRLGDQ